MHNFFNIIHILNIFSLEKSGQRSKITTKDYSHNIEGVSDSKHRLNIQLNSNANGDNAKDIVIRGVKHLFSIFIVIGPVCRSQILKLCRYQIPADLNTNEMQKQNSINFIKHK